jgi:hypothetical protein
VSQDGHIKLWHILQKELVRPTFQRRRSRIPHDSCSMEEKDVPRDAMRPGALSRLRHLMKRARQPQVVIPGGHRMYSRKSSARVSRQHGLRADTAPVTQTLQVGETRNSSRGSNTSALKHGGKWHWQVLEGASPSKHLVAYRPFNARAATALHRPKPL